VTAPIFLIERDRLLSGERILLDGPEGRHAAAVRRIGAGERVDLTDGAGLLAQCRVAVAEQNGLRLDVLDLYEEPAPQPRLVVVQALPKGDRGELAVEAMTEVGVDAIVPWAAARCVTRWRAERGGKSLAKWRTTAREAAKQARRAWVPEVADLAATAAAAELLAGAALPVVLHEQAELPLSGVTVPSAGDVVLVVGPEGGISADELQTFESAGAAAYRLGPTVLRTSTAGVAAAAVLLVRAGRWS